MRPWRLTRRARVEMEAELAIVRAEVAAHRPLRIRVHASGLLGAPDVSAAAPSREWRILRARVALALRAALRADEDARCEEARARVAFTAPPDDEYAHGVDGAHDMGTDEAIEALREWPEVSRDWLGPRRDRVPRALWEVAR